MYSKLAGTGVTVLLFLLVNTWLFYLLGFILLFNIQTDLSKVWPNTKWNQIQYKEVLSHNSFENIYQNWEHFPPFSCVSNKKKKKTNPRWRAWIITTDNMKLVVNWKYLPHSLPHTVRIHQRRLLHWFKNYKENIEIYQRYQNASDFYVYFMIKLSYFLYDVHFLYFAVFVKRQKNVSLSFINQESWRQPTLLFLNVKETNIFIKFLYNRIFYFLIIFCYKTNYI